MEKIKNILKNIWSSKKIISPLVFVCIIEIWNQYFIWRPAKVNEIVLIKDGSIIGHSFFSFISLSVSILIFKFLYDEEFNPKQEKTKEPHKWWWEGMSEDEYEEERRRRNNNEFYG